MRYKIKEKKTAQEAWVVWRKKRRGKKRDREAEAEIRRKEARDVASESAQ